MTRERQKRQSEETRGRILEAARRILVEEGLAALSIRRVTRELEYSAGMVYHYFQSKEELLACLLGELYQKIIAAVRPPDPSLPPDQVLWAFMARFAKVAMDDKLGYQALMLSSAPAVLAVTSVLGEDDLDKRAAMQGLMGQLKRGIAQGIFAPCDVGLTAQVLWSGMFGILTRGMIEGLPPERIETLLHRQAEIYMKGLS